MCPPCAQVAYIFTANRRKSPNRDLRELRKPKFSAATTRPKKKFPDVGQKGASGKALDPQWNYRTIFKFVNF